MLSLRERWAVVIVATLTMTVSYIDRQAMSTLAPSFTKELGISETAFGWIAGAFSIAYLVATPVAGRWLDRVGARRGLVGSVLVWSAVAALHALVPGGEVLFAFRIALGFAEGPGFPGAAQTVQAVLEPHERERGFGLLFTGSSIGAMIVPPFASRVAEAASWRVAFLVTAIAGLAWIPAWLAVTRSAAVRERLGTRAIATLPRPPLGELLRHPAMSRALVAILAAAPAIGLVQQWGAKYLVKTFHLTQGQVGDYLWMPPLVFDLGAVAFGDIAARRRRRLGTTSPPRALVAIGTVLAAALVLLPLARSPWEAMTIAAVSLAGGGALYTLVTADLLARMPPEAVSFAGGTLAAAQSIALVIANPLIGASVDATGGYDTIAISLGAWVIPGALAWLIWPVTAEPARSAAASAGPSAS